jgi:hypothetical protein
MPYKLNSVDDKLLKKVQDGRSNVRIYELVKLMESYGFKWKRTKHGYMFIHDKLKNVTLPHVPIPHGRENKILRRYIDMCLLAIDALLLKGE